MQDLNGEYANHMDGYQLISSILQSLTSLAWPIAFGFCFWIMRKEISALMPKLKLRHGETEFSFIQDVIETAQLDTVTQMINSPFSVSINATSDFQSLTIAQLREEVGRFTAEIREFEARIKEERDADLLDRGLSWDEQTKRLVDRSREQNHEWRSTYQPKGVALRNEMNRRMSRTVDPLNASVALEHGMLAGASPINEAALELEHLARGLGPSLV